MGACGWPATLVASTPDETADLGDPGLMDEESSPGAAAVAADDDAAVAARVG